MTPEQIQERTLAFIIRPADVVAGWIIRVFKYGNEISFESKHDYDIEGLIDTLRQQTLEFYGQEFAELEARINGDPDVAGACCPEGEDQAVIEKP